MGKPRLNIGICQDLALKKGGKCLSTVYINCGTHLLWECGVGHQWNATLKSVKDSDSWCPKCAIDKQTKRKTPEAKVAFRKQYHHNYYLSNKNKILQRNQKYRIENYEKVIETSKQWRSNNLLKHRNTSRVYRNKKIQNDINFKIADRLRSRLQKVIKGTTRVGSAIVDLGCSLDELKAHLESKFLPGMNWKNWSKHGWHIDHIIPLSSFDLSDPNELKKACHYTNLQPLWAKDNLKKSNKTLNLFRRYKVL